MDQKHRKTNNITVHFPPLSTKKVKKTIEVNGGEVDLINLRADNFNPVMSKEDLVAWWIQPFVDKQTNNYFQRLLLADKSSIIGK